MNESSEYAACHCLSPTELKIFELIGKGKTNEEIANELFIAKVTLRSHIRSIYRKLDFKTRTGDHSARTRLALFSREFFRESKKK